MQCFVEILFHACHRYPLFQKEKNIMLRSPPPLHWGGKINLPCNSTVWRYIKKLTWKVRTCMWSLLKCKALTKCKLKCSFALGQSEKSSLVITQYWWHDKCQLPTSMSEFSLRVIELPLLVYSVFEFDILNKMKEANPC